MPNKSSSNRTRSSTATPAVTTSSITKKAPVSTPKASIVDSDLAEDDIDNTDGDIKNIASCSSIASSNPLDISLLACVTSTLKYTRRLDFTTACANSATACIANFNDSIPKHNNPAPHHGKVDDAAHYWVDTSGNILTLKFPAIILTTGAHSRLGPYFNLPTNGIDVSILKKTQAQFELRPLDSPNFSNKAVACSANAFNGLFFLATELELSLAGNNNTSEEKILPNVTPFCHVNHDLDVYTLVANTSPLFHNVPDTNAAQNTMIKQSDISTSKSVPLSPSKVRATALQNLSASTSSPTKKTLGIIYLTDLPNPQYQYEGLSKSNNISSVTIHLPDVRDSHGKIISPSDYATKIPDGDIVEIEVMPKLWIIKPKPSAPPNSKDAAGAHVYQLDLKKLKLLPYAEYVQTDMVKGKGKQKADGKHGENSPGKQISPNKSSTSSLTDDETMDI
ncbi:hypothetical protein SCLCIDRAFT_21954 [Scleroderma citrinum Foug A]|uniref:Uncharacterized protein n=1 Tax=Scleroderma citrinum Foug A TaxID=1036808 RepID=A0A0C3EF06_9AGAM|nr:hypothetical protein SCLCIDRAFT_21954 [Scleroderma citrinum Foug A]